MRCVVAVDIEAWAEEEARWDSVYSPCLFTQLFALAGIVVVSFLLETRKAPIPLDACAQENPLFLSVVGIAVWV